MTKVVGIRFTRTGKIYYFNPLNIELGQGDRAVVETSRGIEMGEVAWENHEVEESSIIKPLKDVIRKATDKDIRRVADNKQQEVKAMELCEGRIEHFRLKMRLINVEYTFDGKKIIFYFTADGRVDFRELVRDLAQRLHSRIELRQIGVRDEAKMLGGIGPCGRIICCNSYMKEFRPVSIKMAKDQNIALNPSKISGLCGRLMCCLDYEHQFYRDIAKKMHKNGTRVITPEGPGVVTANIPLKESMKVRTTLYDGTIDMRTFPLTEVKKATPEQWDEALKNLSTFKREETTTVYTETDDEFFSDLNKRKADSMSTSRKTSNKRRGRRGGRRSNNPNNTRQNNNPNINNRQGSSNNNQAANQQNPGEKADANAQKPNPNNSNRNKRNNNFNKNRQQNKSVGGYSSQNQSNAKKD